MLPAAGQGALGIEIRSDRADLRALLAQLADAPSWRRVAAERAVGFPASEANYTYYLAPGSQHCILPRPELYTLKVGEVSFLDWLRALAEGRTPPRVRP
mgnify:CR=1 FL=1